VVSLRPGVAIDLGTVNSLVMVPGRGLVVEEPTAVAVQRRTGRVVAVGRPAEVLAHREPPDVEVVHPLRDGFVSDFHVTAELLQTFLHRAHFHTGLLRPTAVTCVPSGAGLVERQALADTARIHRPRLRVVLVEEPVAAARGSGVDPSGDQGVLVVDIGGGSTDAAVVVGPHPVRGKSLRVGGNAMDEAIAHMIKAELGVVVGRRAAEQLKISLGLTGGERGYGEVVGIDHAEETLRPLRVEGELVAAALEHSVAPIVESVGQLLTEMPADMADDVVRHKIQLAGGGALLLGLAERLEKVAGVQVAVVDDPLRSVVRGAAAILQQHPEHTEWFSAAG
jgi:rod shape-determining protein MreB and related proteins